MPPELRSWWRQLEGAVRDEAEPGQAELPGGDRLDTAEHAATYTVTRAVQELLGSGEGVIAAGTRRERLASSQQAPNSATG